MLLRLLIASFVLFVLWILLSGFFGTLLLSLGVLSCVFVAWLSEKFGLFRSDFSTLKLTLKIPVFLPWFFIEVVKSNIDVCWRILHPKLPIEPNVMTLDASQHSDLATAIYVNCITLTPGTYSLDLDENSIEVHSLTKALAKHLQTGEMGRRISLLEPKSAKNSSN